MPTVLISGANRGIGLGLARLYAENDWTVLAGAREPMEAEELHNLEGSIMVVPLDVADPASVGILSERLRGMPIDTLIANAGIGEPRGMSFGALDYAAWANVLAVNTLGPMRVAEAFRDHLREGSDRKIVGISSRMGSIASNQSGGQYFYRSSKAALNAAFVSLAHDLLSEEITVALFHPGWVRTDMGGPSASITVEESAGGLFKAINGLTLADTGAFLNYDGEPIAW